MKTTLIAQLLAMGVILAIIVFAHVFTKAIGIEIYVLWGIAVALIMLKGSGKDGGDDSNDVDKISFI